MSKSELDRAYRALQRVKLPRYGLFEDVMWWYVQLADALTKAIQRSTKPRIKYFQALERLQDEAHMQLFDLRLWQRLERERAKGKKDRAKSSGPQQQ